MSAPTVPTVVDWSDLSGWVAALDPARRDQLAEALRDAERADSEQVMLDTVREVLAREQLDRSVLGVVFTTDGWDNGFFLSATGTVVFADGSTDEVEFDDLDHVFTDAIGVRGPEFGLSVNIGTGEVDTDDYADNLYPRLRPPHHLTVHAMAARPGDQPGMQQAPMAA
jgi:hypothetical protein